MRDQAKFLNRIQVKRHIEKIVQEDADRDEAIIRHYFYSLPADIAKKFKVISSGKYLLLSL